MEIRVWVLVHSGRCCRERTKRRQQKRNEHKIVVFSYICWRLNDPCEIAGAQRCTSCSVSSKSISCLFSCDKKETRSVNWTFSLLRFIFGDAQATAVAVAMATMPNTDRQRPVHIILHSNESTIAYTRIRPTAHFICPFRQIISTSVMRTNFRDLVRQQHLLLFLRNFNDDARI